ncbi:hypothetical protein PR001_g17153 [Phytophthora rubi]|uniref:DDE-1 domain-containing protein n=1 Tax=Phytophthora rubi TaxID=129364 RepID=A0A6A3KMK4_9STRA|nr:hypothetical protein PR001_g17153 [Phytophthora rubi]KAE9014594.1 hypothetical protein PR002_g14182 [Phytophthora rubi]
MVTTRRGRRQLSPVQSEPDHEESDERGSEPTDEEEEQKNEDDEAWSNDDEEVTSNRRAEMMEQPTEVTRSTSSSTAELSEEFLEFDFAKRENRDDNVLLLWDDFSGHWTPPVVACAASLNVILLKVLPKYTLKEQLLSYKQGDSERIRKKVELESEIVRIQKSLDQENASRKIAALTKKIDNEKFKLVAPSRKDMAGWITSCWEKLSAETIISGFSKAGLVTDIRGTNPDNEEEIDVDELVEELQRHNIAEEEVTSDDDIGSDVSNNDSSDEDIDRN